MQPGFDESTRRRPSPAHFIQAKAHSGRVHFRKRMASTIYNTTEEKRPFKRAHARERDRKARNPLLPPYFLVHRPRRLYDPSAAALLFKRNAQQSTVRVGRLYFFLVAVLAFLPPLPPASFLSSPCASSQHPPTCPSVSPTVSCRFWFRSKERRDH